jgi:5-methyltetrahydropteroyltriglutamate--homocysteine methyltransferase
MKTARTSKLPAFHTQVIGSLPRPKLLRDLHARRAEIPADRFQGLMDELTLFAIRLQEEAGLDVVSDGEWRRVHYTDEFLQRVGGFERVRPFEHAGERKYHLVVTGRLEPRDPVFARDAEFLRRHTDRVTKFALPSPFMIRVRYWYEEFSSGAYPTPERFMEDVTRVLAHEAKALEQAVFDVIQLDDPALTYFCDRKLMSSGETHDDRLRQEWNPERQIAEAVAAVNAIFAGLGAEVHLHCCHSVYKRRGDVCGNYRPLLPQLASAKIDRVNLEFAYKGTGEVDDLKSLPSHLGVGMGVVDVRSEQLQTVEQIEALGAAGAAVIDPARIALNPDCGFAPDAGEPPTIDEAFEKLRRLVAAAQRLRERFGP